MCGSIIGLIAEACSVARRLGLDDGQTREAARTFLLERVPDLTPGTARVIIDHLFPLAERVPES